MPDYSQLIIAAWGIVLIWYGNSEHLGHAWWKMGLSEKKKTELWMLSIQLNANCLIELLIYYFTNLLFSKHNMVLILDGNSELRTQNRMKIGLFGEKTNL